MSSGRTSPLWTGWPLAQKFALSIMSVSRTTKDGVPGPLGRRWRDTAIRGHIIRGTGILNNELYVSIRVWNRLRFMKDAGARA